MILAVQRPLNLLQLFGSIGEELIVDKYTKLKRILHLPPFCLQRQYFNMILTNKRQSLCEIFRCEIIRNPRKRSDSVRYVNIFLCCLHRISAITRSTFAKIHNIWKLPNESWKKKPQQMKPVCSLSTEVLNVSGSSACHREPHNMAYNSAMKTGAHTQVLVPMTIRQK